MDPDAVELLAGAASGISRLRALGLKIAICSNQSVVGRGLCTRERVDAVHARVLELLNREGAGVDAIFFCPHAPWAQCDCRKPAPGLGLRAAAEFGIAPTMAVVIGDQASDVGFGKSLGARTILVGAQDVPQGADPPDALVAQLPDAATWIEDLL